MKTIPPTCPDFIEHPHIVNGRGCYQCQTAAASESQGTSQIAVELQALGVACDVDQTGGFTMCVYIKTGENSYIYANAESATHFRNANDDQGEDLLFFDDPETPVENARKLKEILDLKKIHFFKIA